MPCPAFGHAQVTGHLPRHLTEVSGAAASPTRPGRLWVVEDSGNPAALRAVTMAGAGGDEVPVRGATNVDWEDLAVAGDDLYVGDIGDNRSRRSSVTVYRVREPSGPTASVDATYHLRYPGGPADAEALLVDPRTGDLLVLTKSWGGTASRILRSPGLARRASATVTMEDAGTVALGRGTGLVVPGDDVVTGASVSADGSTVLVRTYGRVLVFDRRAGESVGEALRRPPCLGPSAPEAQGEAIAVVGRGYVTVSEGAGAPIHRVRGVAPAAGPREPRPVWPVALLVTVVVALLGVVLTRARRR